PASFLDHSSIISPLFRATPHSSVVSCTRLLSLLAGSRMNTQAASRVPTFQEGTSFVPAQNCTNRFEGAASAALVHRKVVLEFRHPLLNRRQALKPKKKPHQFIVTGLSARTHHLDQLL